MLVARLTLVAVLSLLSTTALAHDERQHVAEPERPQDAPPGLRHHDHTPLHGGIVLMSGDDHAELLAEPGGVYRLWYTDGWRRPLTSDVKATLVVKTAAGDETLLLLPTGAKDGELRAQGKAQDDVARTVLLDGFARGWPVKQQFEVRPVFVVKRGATAELLVTDAGFVPADLRVTAGQKTTLRITRKTDATCAKDIVIPGHVQKTPLPLDTPVVVTFTPKKGGNIRYGCSMGQMVGGVIFVP
jgi:hypothetical protein